MSPQILRQPQASKEMGLARATLYQRIKNGLLR
jgi:predicted DNA-binding transcriptional regulator AlpA